MATKRLGKGSKGENKGIQWITGNFIVEKKSVTLLLPTCYQMLLGFVYIK